MIIINEKRYILRDGVTNTKFDFPLLHPRIDLINYTVIDTHDKQYLLLNCPCINTKNMEYVVLDWKKERQRLEINKIDIKGASDCYKLDTSPSKRIWKWVRVVSFDQSASPRFHSCLLIACTQSTLCTTSRTLFKCTGNTAVKTGCKSDTCSDCAAVWQLSCCFQQASSPNSM